MRAPRDRMMQIGRADLSPGFCNNCGKPLVCQTELGTHCPHCDRVILEPGKPAQIRHTYTK